MPEDLNDRVEKFAEAKGLSKNAFINQVMADYVGICDDPSFFTEVRRRLEKLEKEVLQNK
jgi:predicted DNA-binding protein